MTQLSHTDQNKKDRITKYYEKARQDLIDVEQKRKDVIRNLAVNIELEALIPTEWVCEEIMEALQGYGVSSQYIRKCLNKRYKRKYEKKEIEENAPRFIIDTKKILDLVFAAEESKIKEEVLDQELEDVTKEIEAKEALISRQKQRIAELESQLRQEHEEHARQQRTIRVPTSIWRQLQSMEISRRTHTNMIVEKERFLRLEPIIS